jgi:hypothetical protein
MKMTKPNEDSRCSALTKRGKPCRAAPTEGGLCFFHANPKKAAELGRIGGRKNGRVMVGSNPLPELDSATAVRDAVKRLISDVYGGRLHPRTAAGLAPLLQLQMRAIEKADFEQRLAKVEKQLVRLRASLEDAEREKDRPSGMADAYQKRPSQAVKPSGSADGLTADKS